MKTIAVIATALACAAATTSASNNHVERELIVGGDIVPVGTKTYVAGMRRLQHDDNGCAGALIAPSHVLTTADCIRERSLYVSIGEHYSNGTEIGELIRIVSIMKHPSSAENFWFSNDFAVLKLERPSKFTPVKLAAADDSDFKAGKMVTAMGWGTTEVVEDWYYSYDLHRVDLPLASDEACAAFDTVDSSMMCAGGVANKDTCLGDYGGPLVVESATGDVLIGLLSYRKDETCGGEGNYGIFSRVSRARAWIDSVTSGDGKCHS